MKKSLTTRRFALAAACSAGLAVLITVAGCNDSEPAASVEATAASAPAPAKPSLEDLGLQDAPAPTMTLYQAVAANDLEQVRANIAAGADLDELVDDGHRGRFAPLHGAARAGYTEILQLLVDAGADPNVRADAAHRATPLHWAARANQVEAVKILVEAGADINAKAGVDGTLTPMRTAVDRGLHQVVEYLASQGAQM